MNTIQIATIPSRERQLEKTLNSLYGQADQINVFLNGYNKVPEYCLKEGIRPRLTDNSKGDAHKFQGVEKLYGYIYTCDDDLIYPPDYIAKMTIGVDHYKCPVSLHGRTMYPKPVEGYYKKGRKKALRCLYDVDQDTKADVLGTGCLAFHSSQLDFDFDWFLTPNMADVWFSVFCSDQGVDMMVLKHKEGYLTQQHTTGSIFEQEFHKDEPQTSVYNNPLRFIHDYYQEILHKNGIKY